MKLHYVITFCGSKVMITSKERKKRKIELGKVRMKRRSRRKKERKKERMKERKKIEGGKLTCIELTTISCCRQWEGEEVLIIVK